MKANTIMLGIMITTDSAGTLNSEFHSALSEHHKRGGREDKADNAVDDNGQPVVEDESCALARGGKGAEAVKRIGYRSVRDFRNEITGHVNDRGQEIEYAVVG